ncbi:MAG: ATP-binding cassette domain-containing protein [Bacteroidetes bacterium]|nr:MAG: ATP-binding cassette domain-containing protein [Bacteroidota bacterium]
MQHGQNCLQNDKNAIWAQRQPQNACLSVCLKLVSANNVGVVAVVYSWELKKKSNLFLIRFGVQLCSRVAPYFCSRKLKSISGAYCLTAYRTAHQNSSYMGATEQSSVTSAVSRLFSVIKLESKEISAIYFYAVLYGLLQLTVPIGIQSIINFVLAGAFSTSMVILIALVTVGVLFSGVLQVSQMRVNEKIQQQLFTQYAFEFSYRLPKLDMRSVDGYYMPELVNRFFDIVGLQKGLSKLLLDIPVATIQIIFGLLLLSFYNSVFIFFGILLVLLLYLIIRYSSKRGLETSLLESDYKYEVAAWLQEMARVMRSLKFGRQTQMHLHKTDALVSGYLKARTSHFKILMLQYWALIAFKVVITLAMLVVGSVLLINQELNVGQFVAAEIVIITVLASVEKFIVSLDKMYDVLTSVEKLGKVMDKPLEAEGTLMLEQGTPIAVSVKNLTFGYKDNDLVLQNATVDVPAYGLTCFSGSEGSGKSTLLRMFTGAYQQFEGQITINGIPIGNYNVASLRCRIGISFNQQEIFAGTLWENIALGNTTYTPEELMVLAAKIGIDKFIAKLPKGFDTKLDPMGNRLNKTTTQKILLLRALAGKPELLLLEEPCDGMDMDSKRLIAQLIGELQRDTTIILATNDPIFLNNCRTHYRVTDGSVALVANGN